MKAKNNSKNFSYGINGLRGIATIVIALFHFELYFPITKNGVFKTGYIAVEFFFILLGFLIAKSYFEKNRKDTLSILETKLKKLYPSYFIALISLIIVYSLKWYNLNIISWMNDSNHASNFIAELLMLQGSGISNFNYINGPAWYVSALLLNIPLIIYILRKSENKYYPAIFGILSVAIYSFFIVKDYNMSPNYFITGFLSSAFLRGLAGISLGIVSYYIYKSFNNKVKNMNNILFNIIELILFVIFIRLLIFREASRLNILILPTTALLIIMMFSKEGIIDKLFSNKLSTYFGKISFEFYIMQSTCSNIIILWFDNIRQPYITIIYLIINLISGILIYYFVNFFQSKRSKHGI